MKLFGLVVKNCCTVLKLLLSWHYLIWILLCALCKKMVALYDLFQFDLFLACDLPIISVWIISCLCFAYYFSLIYLSPILRLHDSHRCFLLYWFRSRMHDFVWQIRNFLEDTYKFCCVHASFYFVRRMNMCMASLACYTYALNGFFCSMVAFSFY